MNEREKVLRRLATGIAALLLATGTAHAIYFSTYDCGHGVYVEVENLKHPPDDVTQWRYNQTISVQGLRDATRQLRRVKIGHNGAVYFNGRRCKGCPSGATAENCHQQ